MRPIVTYIAARCINCGADPGGGGVCEAGSSLPTFMVTICIMTVDHSAWPSLRQTWLYSSSQLDAGECPATVDTVQSWCVVTLWKCVLARCGNVNVNVNNVSSTGAGPVMNTVQSSGRRARQILTPSLGGLGFDYALAPGFRTQLQATTSLTTRGSPVGYAQMSEGGF